MPRKIGLMHFKDGKCSLTDIGNRYLETKDLHLLYETISKNILAFDDIYEFIGNAGALQNEEQIPKYLKENFDIGGSKYHQVSFRLLWLLNLSKVKYSELCYSAA